MNSPKILPKKRKRLAGLVSDMTGSLREHQEQAMQSLKELIVSQGTTSKLSLAPFSKLSFLTASLGMASLNINSLHKLPLNKTQALDMLEQLQDRVSPHYCSDLCAQSPWFGSEEKRLTGLGSAALFIPVSAESLAKKHQPFTVHQQLERVTHHTELLKEQLQRKIDRLTGVRVKADEWETTFPEDE